MTDTVAFKPRLIQHGISDVFVPLWTEFTLPDAEGAPTAFVISAFDTYIQVYDFEISRESERNLNTPNRRYYTQTSQNLFFNLTWPTGETAKPTTDLIDFRYGSEVTSSTWSNSNLPEDSSRLFIAPQNSQASYLTWTLNSNGTTYDMLAPIDFNSATGSDQTGIVKTTLMQYTSQPKWDGRLTIYFRIINNWILNIPSNYSRGFLTGQYIPYYTGWDNRPADRGRPIPDMRSGLPAFAEDLVEDGYNPGIWTSSANWDPVDPRWLRPTEFPDDESTKKDDVPV